MSHISPELLEMRHMIAVARLDFLRSALPLARNDDEYKLAASIAKAIGEVSVDEAMIAYRRELAGRLHEQE